MAQNLDHGLVRGLYSTRRTIIEAKITSTVVSNAVALSGRIYSILRRIGT